MKKRRNGKRVGRSGKSSGQGDRKFYRSERDLKYLFLQSKRDNKEIRMRTK